MTLRALPPSLRFLGRRLYVGAVVLLAGVAAQLCSAWRAARSATGVLRRTLLRWGDWWRGEFPGSSTWASLQARFTPPPPDRATLPGSLVARLGLDLAQQGLAATLPDVCELAAHCSPQQRPNLCLTDNTSTPARARLARFRFGVVAQLLTSPPEPGELGASLAAQAARSWPHPTTSEAVRFSVKTIERWFYGAGALDGRG